MNHAEGFTQRVVNVIKTKLSHWHHNEVFSFHFAVKSFALSFPKSTERKEKLLIKVNVIVYNCGEVEKRLQLLFAALVCVCEEKINVNY